MRGGKESETRNYLDRELLGKRRFCQGFYDERGGPVGAWKIHCIRGPHILTCVWGLSGQAAIFHSPRSFTRKHLEPPFNRKFVHDPNPLSYVVPGLSRVWGCSCRTCKSALCQKQSLAADRCAGLAAMKRVGGSWGDELL